MAILTRFALSWETTPQRSWLQMNHGAVSPPKWSMTSNNPLQGGFEAAPHRLNNKAFTPSGMPDQTAGRYRTNSISRMRKTDVKECTFFPKPFKHVVVTCTTCRSKRNDHCILRRRWFPHTDNRDHTARLWCVILYSVVLVFCETFQVRLRVVLSSASSSRNDVKILAHLQQSLIPG